MPRPEQQIESVLHPSLPIELFTAGDPGPVPLA
jgi:hypothetical protein